jgi:hypothetical protein
MRANLIALLAVFLAATSCRPKDRTQDTGQTAVSDTHPMPSAVSDTHPMPSAVSDTHPMPSAVSDTHPMPSSVVDSCKKVASPKACLRKARLQATSDTHPRP